MLDIERRYLDGSVRGGWQKDPGHMEQLAREQAHMAFSKMAPDVMDMPNTEVFLWRFLYEALRQYYDNASYVWKPQYQKEGTCGGQGTKLGLDTVAAVDALLYYKEFPGRFAVAGTYTAARVEVYEQPGQWQGCAGSWLAEAVIKYGGLLLKSIPLDDESKDEDEQLALRWTNSREGVPANFQQLMSNLIVQSAPQIRNTDELAKSLQNGCPAIKGSNLIANGQRDRRGFSPVQRSRTGHLTLFWGVRLDSAGKVDGFLDQNSWSENWGSGGVYPDDQPPGSVWISVNDAQAQIDEGDCYALCGINGTKPRLVVTP